jgi:hypothetical protein
MAGILAGCRGRLGSHRVIADGFEPTIFPVAAIERARAEQLQGRLFSEFAWGGYVLYAWPEQKVFIDGGTDFYGEVLFREYATIKRMVPGWRKVLAKWELSLLLLRRESALAHELSREPGWDLWYCDSVAVFLRRREKSSIAKNADSSEARLDACATRSSGDSARSQGRIATPTRDSPHGRRTRRTRAASTARMAVKNSLIRYGGTCTSDRAAEILPNRPRTRRVLTRGKSTVFQYDKREIRNPLVSNNVRRSRSTYRRLWKRA